MARIRRRGDHWEAEIELEVYGVPTGVIAQGRTVSRALMHLGYAYRETYERPNKEEN